MSTWTVVHSSDFILTLTKIQADFKKHYEEILRTQSRVDVEKIDLRFKEFEHFTQDILDLKDGNSEPAKVLRYCQPVKDGLPIYSLVRGRWRGLYRVDEPRKTCTAISVDELTTLTMYVEKFRQPFRKRLR
jgi:hypothetical protein